MHNLSNLSNLKYAQFQNHQAAVPNPNISSIHQCHSHHHYLYPCLDSQVSPHCARMLGLLLAHSQTLQEIGIYFQNIEMLLPECMCVIMLQARVKQALYVTWVQCRSRHRMLLVLLPGDACMLLTASPVMPLPGHA